MACMTDWYMVKHHSYNGINLGTSDCKVTIEFGRVTTLAMFVLGWEKKILAQHQNMLWIPAILAIGVSAGLILEMSETQQSPAAYYPNDREKMKQCFDLLTQYNVDISDPATIKADIQAFATQMNSNPELKVTLLACLEREKGLCQNSAYYNMRPFLCENVLTLEEELASMQGGGGVSDDLESLSSARWTTVSDIPESLSQTQQSGIATMM